MDDWSALVGPYDGSLIDTFGAATVKRALELSKGQPPEANIMPYIYRALDEARKSAPNSKPPHS